MRIERRSEAIWEPVRERWMARVQVDGKRKSFYSTTPGKRGKSEAERKADEWLRNGASDDPRLEFLWGRFLAEVEPIREGASSARYVKHESIGRLYILPQIGLKRISKITIQHWQDCINAAYAKGLSKKTCINIRASITALYRYAHKNRLFMERPEFLTIPSDAPVAERHILQPDELRTLFHEETIVHYGKEHPCFFIYAWRFMVLTGLRRGELCGLKNEDLRNGVLYINRSINSQQEETRGKNMNAKRYIALSGRMLDILTQQKEWLKKNRIISPWMFPDEHGNCLNSNHLYKIWYTYRNQHGIQSSLHELRHTMVSIVKADIPESLLKPLIGHSKAMDTTGIYGHEVDGEAVKTAQMIDDVFDRILD